MKADGSSTLAAPLVPKKGVNLGSTTNFAAATAAPFFATAATGTAAYALPKYRAPIANAV
eukprot:CAMPEP_0194152462 /NCGR_PEP_ID=MMETSP0152-20130528/52467_1 /TAXON_ID=1049557 /ORGANISM="Thalassiothrix antarctica, Strain L6-D1" /LENGTH=59 /DNA_ID=CAMNT_0038856985 /DNA_START=621 /DNA_END=800 /DNA_ORIENTATION=+